MPAVFRSKLCLFDQWRRAEHLRDELAVKVLKTVPKYARHYSADTRAWHIHPAYANKLADALRRIGFDIHWRTPETAA